MLHHGMCTFKNLLYRFQFTIYIAYREDRRQTEIQELISQGKISHDQELEKHPELSIEGRMCKNRYLISIPDRLPTLDTGLMGRVAGSINVSSIYCGADIKPTTLCTIGHQTS